jgi:hypothetical protein
MFAPSGRYWNRGARCSDARPHPPASLEAHPYRRRIHVKKALLIPAAVAGIAVSALFASETFAAQGSGKSAEHRSDNFVVLCHYDRNLNGPNAGPHTITINENALDKHLDNHVKAEGWIGDDHLGACDPDTEPTVEPTIEPDVD